MTLFNMPALEEPTGGFDLRWYQVDTIDALRQELRMGHKRVVLCAPTGSGKTYMGAHLIREALAKGSRVGFIVDRIPLVRQTVLRFSDMGIPYGVIQAGNSFGRREQALICSAQTLEKMNSWPRFDLLIVDECHSIRKATKDIIEAVQIPVIGLSATPFTKGLGNLYSSVVNCVTTDELIAAIDPNTGLPYLAPLRVFTAREIDMTGAKRDKGGEWTPTEVETRGNVIIGDAVGDWQAKCDDLFGGPQKTLVRSATVAHGERICRAFQAAGFDFRQASYQMSEAENERTEWGFRHDEFLGLVSVDKFNKGFDVPDIRVLIDQRPLRKSLASEIQFIGRGMRSSPGKEFVLLLDHTGNYLGFMEDILDFFEHGVTSLDETKHRESERQELPDRKQIVCAGCGFVMTSQMTMCPSCGKEKPIKVSGVSTRPGRMEEITHSKAGFDWKEYRPWTWEHMCAVARDRKGSDEVAAYKFALAQYHSLFGEWPDRAWGFKPAEVADPRVVRKVKAQLVVYFKSKK